MSLWEKTIGVVIAVAAVTSFIIFVITPLFGELKTLVFDPLGIALAKQGEGVKNKK